MNKAANLEPSSSLPENQENSVFDSLVKMGHENLVFCQDNKSGLKAMIAIHDTRLGPSLGGTRFWHYETEAAAISDVLRLSRGMTYKAAISGVNLGGGKAVIIGNSRTDKSEALWRRYGDFVESLGGRYITAEDVGTATADMEIVAQQTKWVSGKPAHLGGGGDPSPVTAYGVFLGLKAGLKKCFGSDSVSGKTVLVQGCGSVGMYLIELLHKEGARILATDIYEDSVRRAVEDFGATAVSPEEVWRHDMDVYAPCALGATLNDISIPELKCQLVAGAANNQLQSEQTHGAMLKERGILYVPDFLLNAGGLINCYAEYIGDYNRAAAMAMVEKIYDRSLQIFDRAEADNSTPLEAAMAIAEDRLEEAQ